MEDGLGDEAAVERVRVDGGQERVMRGAGFVEWEGLDLQPAAPALDVAGGRLRQGQPAEAVALTSVLARATSRSYMRWRLSQKSGVMPRARPRAQRGVGRDAAAAVDDLVDADLGYAHGLGEAVLGDTQLLQHLGQVFAGVDRLEGGHGAIVACPKRWAARQSSAVSRPKCSPLGGS